MFPGGGGWENSRFSRPLTRWAIPAVLAVASGYIVYKLTDDKDDDIVMLQNALESDISRHEGSSPYSGVGRTWQEGGSMLSDFPSLNNNSSIGNNNDISYRNSENGAVGGTSNNTIAVGNTAGQVNGNNGSENLVKDAAFEELHSIVEILNLQSTAVQTLEQAITTAVTKISLLETSNTPPLWARDLARSISIMRDDIADIKKLFVVKQEGREYSIGKEEGEQGGGSGVSYYNPRKDSVIITDIDNVQIQDRGHHSHHSIHNNQGMDDSATKTFGSPRSPKKSGESSRESYSPFNSEFVNTNSTSSNTTIVDDVDTPVLDASVSALSENHPQSPKQAPKQTPTKAYYTSSASTTPTKQQQNSAVSKKGENEFLDNIYAQTLLMIELARFKSKVKFDICLIGIGAIIIYVSNIIDNPDAPRYRRISTNNTNYKMVLMPLSGHELVLESLGYQRHGASFDHTWKIHSKSKLDSSPIKNNNNSNNSQSAANLNGAAPDETIVLSILTTAVQFFQDIQQADSYDSAIATVAVHQSIASK